MLANLHLGRFGSIAALIVIVEVFGQGKCFVLIFAQIFEFGQPGTVASLVVHKEYEGLALVALVLHPVNGLVGHDVGHIALFACFGAVHVDKVGVVIVTLCRQNVVVVKARGGAHQVPLANDGGLVASLLHEFGHGLLRTVKHAVLIISKAILV